MIPKIIHYCWLSGEEYPDKIRRCMDSWKRMLPDYEFRLWDKRRFDIESSVWVKEAVAYRKYAFAADYIRLYALYHFGGIYLDSDVEVLRNFNDLLDLPYFVGKENSKHGMEAAVMGAEKECGWIGRCLSYYEKRHFVHPDRSLSMNVLPEIMTNILTVHYRFKDIRSVCEFIRDEQVVCRFSVDYFSPKSYITKKINITENTRTIHHFAGTWQPMWKQILLKLWVPLSVKYPVATDKIKTFFNNQCPES